MEDSLLFFPMQDLPETDSVQENEPTTSKISHHLQQSFPYNDSILYFLMQKIKIFVHTITTSGKNKVGSMCNYYLLFNCDL